VVLEGRNASLEAVSLGCEIRVCIHVSKDTLFGGLARTEEDSKERITTAHLPNCLVVRYAF
jgi:hypothetical protein